jgi:hypothetical protein
MVCYRAKAVLAQPVENFLVHLAYYSLEPNCYRKQERECQPQSPVGQDTRSSLHSTTSRYSDKSTRNLVLLSLYQSCPSIPHLCAG